MKYVIKKEKEYGCVIYSVYNQETNSRVNYFSTREAAQSFIERQNKPMKIYHYPITDCEHDGDISSAEYEVQKAGGEVVSSYWDGNDCGEAYVEFTVADNIADKVCDKLGYYKEELYRYTKKQII